VHEALIQLHISASIAYVPADLMALALALGQGVTNRVMYHSFHSLVELVLIDFNLHHALHLRFFFVLSRPAC
jgi:hypothetical protein